MALFKWLTEFWSHFGICQRRKYIPLGKPNSNGRKLVSKVEWVTDTKNACEWGLQVFGEMHILPVSWMVKLWSSQTLSPVRFFTSLTTGIFGVRSATILVEHSLFVGGKEKQQTTTYFIQVSLFQTSWDYVNVDLFLTLPHASFCFICSPKFSHMGQDLLKSTGQKLSKTHTGVLTLK